MIVLLQHEREREGERGEREREEGGGSERERERRGESHYPPACDSIAHIMAHLSDCSFSSGWMAGS